LDSSLTGLRIVLELVVVLVLDGLAVMDWRSSEALGISLA
jgi:hypothetical protein